MATAVQKITLSSSRDIPFNKLVLSQSNVRRVKAGVSIEELAEDIARRTLLQGLNVRPVLDADGVETGMFEVPPAAGATGRSNSSSSRSVSPRPRRCPASCAIPASTSPPRKTRWPRTSSARPPSARSVPRLSGRPQGPVRGGDRRRLLRQRDRGEAAAASRGRVGEAPRRLCRRRHDARAAHGVHGHDRSRASGAGLGDASRPYNKEPYQIRRMLTERTVRASDKRALFVGVDAYQAAGRHRHARLFPAGRWRLAAESRRCSIAWSPRS